MGREELHVGDDDERLGQEQRGDPVVAFISGVSLLPRIATAAHFIVLGLLLVDLGGTLCSWTKGWRRDRIIRTRRSGVVEDRARHPGRV